MTWLLPLRDLTPEQQRAVRLSTKEHRIVLGAPGSGKTQIMLHRAAYLREHENLTVDRLHIFVFTKVLKRYIQSGLEILDVPLDCVSTLDSWCAQFLRDVVGRIAYGKNVEERCRETRRMVLDWLRTNKRPPILYDCALVDEGQDLHPPSFELLTRIARHVTVYMDPKQQIYDQRSTEQDVLRALGLRKRNMTLLDAFRCCPHIIHVASAFIPDEEERRQYILQARTAQVEKDTPLLYLSSNFDDERSRLIDIIRTRQLKGDLIGILFPLTRQVAGFAKGLREAGLQVEAQDVSRNRSGDDDGLDFETRRPKLMTYYGAKGLTFDTVLMPRLTAKANPDISQERIERLLFVAITRATKWIYMSTSSGKDLPCLSKLEPLAASRHLVIQDSAVTTDDATAPPDEDDPTSLL